MKKLISRLPDSGTPRRRRRIAARAPLIGFLCLLSVSCAAVGPNYMSPKSEAPAAWHSEMQDGLDSGPVDMEELAEWWEVFNDPMLTELIDEAVRDNLDLKQAEARIRQARALRGVSQSRLFPTVDAVGRAEIARKSETVDNRLADQLYAAGFDAGWELDIFGGLRRSIEASDAELQASIADLRDVLISLTAEVALNYVDVRTFQSRLAVAKANLSSQENTYGFIRSRHEAGLINRLALEQARYNLEDTRSNIPALETGLEAAKNRLAVLLGKAPGQVHPQLKEVLPAPVPPLSVAVGVPAETLRRRPDVRRAERELAAPERPCGGGHRRSVPPVPPCGLHRPGSGSHRGSLRIGQHRGGHPAFDFLERFRRGRHPAQH